MRVWILLGAMFLVFPGCSSGPKSKNSSKESPQVLFKSVCETGKAIKAVHGNIWLKTYSKEVSGQFSANVVVTPSDQVKLEITNIFGGIEALITVDERHYEISDASGKKKTSDQGLGTWGGIPLHWASALFRGQIPCPNENDSIQVNTNSDGAIVVLVAGRADRSPQKFVYQLRTLDSGRAWPEALHWERLSVPPITVDFKFDDPEESTLSPKKWEARSVKGAVKIRWKDRETIK